MYGKKSSSHEKVCVFAPCSCPVKNCNYIGSYKDLNNHVRDAHKASETLIMPFKFNSSVYFYLRTYKNKMAIFQEEKEGDVIVVQGFNASHGVYVTVSHIAPAVPEMRKFSCKLGNSKQYGTTLRLGLQVKNVQKLREEEELPENDFMLIPSYMLSGGFLKMKMKIGNK